jgi:hypothetical protein
LKIFEVRKLYGSTECFFRESRNSTSWRNLYAEGWRARVGRCGHEKSDEESWWNTAKRMEYNNPDNGTNIKDKLSI